jgi:hypothetical protein
VTRHPKITTRWLQFGQENRTLKKMSFAKEEKILMCIIFLAALTKLEKSEHLRQFKLRIIVV